MRPGRTRAFAGAATIGAAAIGCLQPGIDPVFLTILSAAHDLDPDRHGWIVGATQGGMALGALIVWRFRPVLPPRIGPVAAGAALLCGLATAYVSAFFGLVLVRAAFGLAIGIVYTDAMSEAAARRPAAAYGAVFLIQLILSTVVAFALPLLSDAAGPQSALLALAVAPLVAAALLLLPRRDASIPATAPDRKPGTTEGTSPAAWALAGATFAFICATMMVWSFVGALAMRYDFDEDMIGLAVALGSIAGALTALAVMRETPIIPLPFTGLLAGACLLSPLILTPLRDEWLFVGAILLLNIGSTAIIIRASGAATAAGDDPLFRRFVACTHPLGMIAGPVVGAILTQASGPTGLEGGAFAALAGGSLLLLFAHQQTRERNRHGARAAA
jgi:predicted MFS family arabinose efflux permease